MTTPPASADPATPVAVTAPAAPATEAAPARRRRRWPRIVLLVIGIVLLVGVAGAAWWLQPQPLLPEATAALASTDTVTFSDDQGFLAFAPADAEPQAGFIFYPGGKVEPAAYARSAQVIAEAGYLVAIVPMPLNLAVLNANGADAVMAAYPDITTWVIGGHSLGGAMAGQYVDQHPGTMDGLVLWAAYPNGDLSDQADLPVLSIYGSLDAGAERFTSDATLLTLPDGTRFLEIEGGNHEQMGDYTGQPNDPPAAITRDEQQAEVQEATLTFLNEIAADAGL